MSTEDPTVDSVLRFLVNLGLGWGITLAAGLVTNVYFGWQGAPISLSSVFDAVTAGPSIAIVLAFALLATTARHFAAEHPDDLTRTYYINGGGALAALLVLELVVRLVSGASNVLDFVLLFSTLVVPVALCYGVVMTHLGRLILQFARFNSRAVDIALYGLFLPVLLALAILYCSTNECFL